MEKGGQERGYFYYYYCLFVFHQLTVLNCPVWQKGDRRPWEGGGAAVCVWPPKKQAAVPGADDRTTGSLLVA